MKIWTFTFSSVEIGADWVSCLVHANVMDVFSEQSISEEGRIARCTANSGADIKRLCSRLSSAQLDCRIPHLLNIVVQYYACTSLKLAETKNADVRENPSELERIFEHIHKSLGARIQLEGIQIRNLGFSYKLGTHAPHKWCSTAKVVGTFARL